MNYEEALKAFKNAKDDHYCWGPLGEEFTQAIEVFKRMKLELDSAKESLKTMAELCEMEGKEAINTNDMEHK